METSKIEQAEATYYAARAQMSHLRGSDFITVEAEAAYEYQDAEHDVFRGWWATQAMESLALAARAQEIETAALEAWHCEDCGDRHIDGTDDGNHIAGTVWGVCYDCCTERRAGKCGYCAEVYVARFDNRI